MVQIARTALPANQVFYVALARIFGIGQSSGLEVAESCGISKEMKVKDIKEQHIQRVSQYIQDNYVVGDSLKRNLRENILQMIRLKTYRGQRHELGLAIAGHTQSNNKNAKKLRHHIMYDTSK